MKILVLAQAVDENDPLFSFFVDWLRGASQVFTEITVLALRVGFYALPKNVIVVPLRSVHTIFRWMVVKCLIQESWRRRKEYQGVFVRGDAQYLVLAGWLWRLLGKRVIFWYTHANAVTFSFWFGQCFAHEVVTATGSANPLSRSVVIGHHINTDLFTFDKKAVQLGKVFRILIFGRTSSIKRIPWLVETIAPLLSDQSIQLTIAGPSLTKEERFEIGTGINGLPIQWLDRSFSISETKKIFAEHDVLVNSTNNSLDKVILEAAASGLCVVASSPALRIELEAADQWLCAQTSPAIRQAILRLQVLSTVERLALCRRLRQWVLQKHGQTQYIQRLASLFTRTK